MTTDTGNTEPLAGYKLAALQKQLMDNFQTALDDVELRKIALEAAARLYQAQLGSNLVTPVDPVEMARAMHAFLAEPAQEVVVKIGP